MTEQILAWLEKAKVSVETKSKEKWPDCQPNWSTLVWTEGPKYFNVRVCHSFGSRASAYCFIDKEGNIYKAEGWRKPAKGVRGTIATVDPTTVSYSTAWLYRRLDLR